MNRIVMLNITLITGASSGIGRELALCCAAAHQSLLLSGRDEIALAETATACRAAGAAEVRSIAVDLAKPDGADELWSRVQAEQIDVDILVNNAGFGTHGKFWHNDADAERDLVTVNIAALVRLTRLALPAMVERRRGRVMNVASTAAFQPGPLMANYYASKAFVLSFTEAIANELRRTGVTATALCPGPTITDFQNRAGIAHSPLFAKVGMTAAAVAAEGFAAMNTGRPVCIPGFKNRMLVRAGRFAPRRFLLRTVRRLNESR